MTLFLVILAIAVVFLLAARSIKNRKQHSATAGKNATRDKKRGRSKKFGLDPLAASELNFENKAQPDALSAAHKLKSDAIESEGIEEVEKPSPLVIIHLIAEENKPYHGYELLQTLLANNLRHGEHEIFHYYEGKGSQASPLFSVTSLNKPGTFDLPKMGEFSCDGLILFSQLDQVKDPELAVRQIMQTAEAMADSLGGYLADEQRLDICDQFSRRLANQVSHYTKRHHSIS